MSIICNILHFMLSPRNIGLITQTMDIITSLSLEFRSSNDTVPGRFQPQIQLSNEYTGPTLFGSQEQSRPVQGISRTSLRPESTMPVIPNIRDNNSLRMFSPSQVNYSVEVSTPPSAYESRYSKPTTLLTQKDIERAERRSGIKSLGSAVNPSVRIVGGVSIDMDKLNANASRGRKESYTVKELQGIASDLGLNSKGTKPVLVKTIRDRISAEDLVQSDEQYMSVTPGNEQDQVYESNYNPEQAVNVDDTFNQYQVIDDPSMGRSMNSQINLQTGFGYY